MIDDLLSRPVTLNRADGTALTFRILSPAQRMQFRAVFRTYRKMWLIESLRLLGFEGREAVAYCNELDGRRVREGHIVEWLNEPEGQNEAILLSLRSANPAATMEDVHALGLSDDERLTAGAGVLLVKVGPAKGGTDAEGEAPFAAAPGTGGTGTTDATPTSSADSADTPTPSPSPSTSSTPTSPTPSTSAA